MAQVKSVALFREWRALASQEERSATAGLVGLEGCPEPPNLATERRLRGEPELVRQALGLRQRGRDLPVAGQHGDLRADPDRRVVRGGR